MEFYFYDIKGNKLGNKKAIITSDIHSGWLFGPFRVSPGYIMKLLTGEGGRAQC